MSNLIKGDSFIKRLKTLKLFDECGIGYGEVGYKAMFLDYVSAFQMLIDSQTDAIPTSDWDKQVFSALRDNEKEITSNCNILERMNRKHLLRRRREEIDYLISEKIHNSPMVNIESLDVVLLTSHCSLIVYVRSIIEDGGNDFKWKLLIDASECLMQGFLPVGLNSKEHLIYLY